MTTSAATLPRMTSDEFLVWAEAQPDAKFELHDGVVVPKGEPFPGAPQAMAGGAKRHSVIGRSVNAALAAALDKFGSPRASLIDDLAIRVDGLNSGFPDIAVDVGDFRNGLS